MKIRNGFVSNSSSSSFLIIKPGPKCSFRSNDKMLKIDYSMGTNKFGWERRRYEDVYSKIIFSYLQIQYAKDNPRYPKNLSWKEWLQMLEKVIKEESGVVVIKWDSTLDLENEKINSYIDHASSAEEGENTEMFDSEETLKTFLFSINSYIHGDNDNDYD